jgi:hypothetical protein
MRALGGKDMQSRFPWRKLDIIYLWMIAPLILAMVYILPPFQAPDEAAHFYRAVQISHGQFRPAIAPPTTARGPAVRSIPRHINWSTDIAGCRTGTAHGKTGQPLLR